MKILYTTLAFLTLFCFKAFAQFPEKSDVELAGNIGYSSATVNASRNYYSDIEYKSGFNIGVSADYYFSNKWSFRGRLIYDQKGWEEAQGGSYQYYKIRLNYLTIPLMANWHFGTKRNWYLNFGPYVGFLLNAKETTTNTNVTSGLNSTDIGLSLGIGVKIPVSNKYKILIEYDGQTGFSNIIKDNSGPSVGNIREAFNVGVVFNLNN